MPAFVTSQHAPVQRVAGESQLHQWSSLVGIVTAIVGNILISFALNTQRYAHIRIDREYKDRHDPHAKEARRHLPKSIRNYGTAVQQEEVAEERRRINEEADDPKGVTNGKTKDHQRQHSDSTVTPDEENDETQGRQSYLKSPYWWAGIIMMTIGETGNFLAYGFAPASIVSPLGVVALISNCLIAPLMLKERFRQRDFWGVMIAIGGAVVVVLSAKTSEKKLGPDTLWADIKRWEFLTYVLITTIAIIALMLASPKYGKKTIVVDLGLVGLYGGYTALSTKGVASLLSGSLYRAFTYPIFYVLVLILVVSAIMQIRYLNRGLQNFDSTQVIPVQFVMFTLSVIIGSAVLYRDFERTDVDHALKFIFGCLLTFSGVYLITSGRKNDDEDEESEPDDAGTIRLLDEEAAVNDQRPLKQETRATNGKLPELRTPKMSQRSRASSAVPSITLTPAGEDRPSLNKNPFISSTDHLANTLDRPTTPIAQVLPSSSQTPFFTPETTAQLAKEPIGPPDGPLLGRTLSTPAQPETPTRTAPSPSRPDDLIAANLLMRSTRGSINSISRLLPGPIFQPFSSSLSGIVADHLLRGEGASPRSPLRRYRSHREARRKYSNQDDTPSQTPFSAAPAGPSSSETQVDRLGQDSPLLKRAGTADDALAYATLKASKGRGRSMSETLSGLMDRARGKPSMAERDEERQQLLDEDQRDDAGNDEDGGQSTSTKT